MNRIDNNRGGNYDSKFVQLKPVIAIKLYLISNWRDLKRNV